jgi:succinoglycan biosynthesis protein ExoV
MKYLFYKSERGNFGDDLNLWLWPKLFTDVEKEDTFFIGIGSILYNDFPQFKEFSDKDKKIVFGTGIRPTNSAVVLDESWDIKFLRGPLSSLVLNNKFEFIADSAYALRQLENFSTFTSTPKKYDVSVMPYFKSLEFTDWKAICKQLNYHYISPLGENGVEFTLSEIASSKHIITEAMHGAIIADALRVPWHRLVFSTPYTEGAKVSDFKWLDWQFSIGVNNINTTHIRLYRKSFIHDIIKKISFDTINTEFLIKGIIKTDLLKSLFQIKDFYLSDDSVLSIIDSRIGEKIKQVRYNQ